MKFAIFRFLADNIRGFARGAFLKELFVLEATVAADRNVLAWPKGAD
jgi:hypothetical protein